MHHDQPGLPQRPALRDDIVIREVDDDVVAYDPVSDSTTLLNRSAALVLSLCDGSRTSEQITSEIETVFRLERGGASADVQTTLDAIHAGGLFRLSSRP